MRDIWEGASITIHHADLYPCQPAWSIPHKLTPYCGLFFIIKGAGWVQMDQRRYDALPGDLFIWRAKCYSSAGHDPANPVTVLSAGFTLRGPGHVDIFRPLVLPDRLRLPPRARRELSDCYHVLIHDCHDASAHARLTARGSFLRLLGETLRWAEELPDSAKSGGAPALPGDETRAASVLAHIDAQLASKLTLEKLARVAHLSPIYFAKLFRKQTGLSPMAYVRQRRIEQARAMLMNGDETVERVALAVGFADPFHFSRSFRRLTGQSPSAFRASFENPFSR